MKYPKNTCQSCGNDEFTSQPNSYDVFKLEKNKLVLQSSEAIDDKLELYCRECSEELIFDEKSIKI